MNIKKIIIVSLLLTIFTLSAVNAAENMTSDELTVDEVDIEEVSQSQDDVDVVGKTIKTPGTTFSDIRSKIDTANDGDIISLTKTKYSSDDTGSIVIDKSITIQSSSKTQVVLDGKNSNQIISAYKDITFVNICFKNSKDFAINAYSSCTLKNCSFVNNQGGLYALSSNLPKVMVENCIFKSNTDQAIFAQGVDLTVENSQFIKNTLKGNIGTSGAAIYSSSSNVNVKSSNFTGNVALSGGGAIYFSSGDNRISIYNSIFMNNEAEYGSAISCWSSSVLENNIFINNKGDDDIENIGYFPYENHLFINNVIANDLGEYHAKMFINQLGNNLGDLVEVKLLDENNLPLSNKKVMFYSKGMYDLNGETTTDNQGIAKFNPAEYEGNYDINVIADLGNFKLVSSKLNMIFSKIDAVAIPQALVTYYNSGTPLKIQVINKNTGKAIAGVELSVYLSGNKISKYYDVVTDNNGFISIPTSSLNTGKYSIEIVYYDIFKGFVNNLVF